MLKVKQKIKGAVKKMFRRQNLVLTVGVLLIFSGVLVWVVNFSFVKMKNAKAYDVVGNSGNCTAGESGCFGETWIAEEVLGNPEGSTGSALYVGLRSGDVYKWGAYRLDGATSATVVKWTVVGKILQ